MTRCRIRSTSTTDIRPGEPIRVYHVWLLPPERRLRAWWTACPADAWVLPDREAAEAAMRDLTGTVELEELPALRP